MPRRRAFREAAAKQHKGDDKADHEDRREAGVGLEQGKGAGE